ncbi:nucleotidyltransferase family protein [Methyloligella solikamskensis]|uniref:NTP transferase domain-containing protein n=1 Tax=Methyloligella solikamskensis TaxID=1177756 RepID=A0ABW3J4Y3_9HYPH
MTTSPFIAILAAGRASRFGKPKLDAPLAGRPVGHWVLEAVSSAGLPPGVVVVGPTPPDFLQAWPDWERLENPDPGRGLGSSLAIAAQEAATQEADAMLVLLADMPLLDPVFLNELASAETPAATIQDDGRPGAPALLPRSSYEALQALDGDRGAGKLLAQAPGLTLLRPPTGMLIDIDRPEDLARAEAELASRAKR